MRTTLTSVHQCISDAAFFTTLLGGVSVEWDGLGLNEAADNLRHYLSGLGTALEYQPIDPIAGEIGASGPFLDTLTSADARLAETLALLYGGASGRFVVTSLAVPLDTPPAWDLRDRNLGLAIGALRPVGVESAVTFSGTVVVIQQQGRVLLQYSGQLTFAFRDRYEFDDRAAPSPPFNVIARLVEACGPARPFDASYTVAANVRRVLPPQVERVVVNGGAAQRSVVSTIRVTFDTVVNVAAGAFSITRDGGGGTVGFTYTTSLVAGKTIVVLTLDRAMADGRYTLRIRGDRVVDAAWGDFLDGDGNGTAGGDHTGRFHRLFGDGDVDNVDFASFRSTFRKRVGDAGYLAYFDFDGDGVVDQTDMIAFLDRRGSSV